MADVAALARAASNTAKMTSSIKGMWDARTKVRATLNEATAWDLVVRAQVDEIFLVLAHLGEAILPLGVFDKDYYLQTLGDVQASIASCGNEFLPMAWEELDAELQYVCTAGMAFCSTFSPMPVYRGFGACVLGDWDWACPDLEYLREKAQKKAIRTIYGFKQKVDPQPTRSLFQAFDQAIQILQVKPMAFMVKRPIVSGFADQQPRYGLKPKKEARHELNLLDDWLKQLMKRDHPSPKGGRFTSWGIPFATWTSQYNCHLLKSDKDAETIVLNQMDPGRLLHAFVCRGNINLDGGQILLLPQGSPAESLLCWLEGLPGTSHKMVKWQDLDTEHFEKKLSKSLRKQIGHYPLPTQYAIRDPNAAVRPSLIGSTSSPAVLEHPNTVSPPPYTRSSRPTPSAAELQGEQGPVVAELGSPDPMELPANPASSSPHHPQHSASIPVPGATGSQPSGALKSIHDLRRNPVTTASTLPSSTRAANTTRHPTILRPGEPPNSIAGRVDKSKLIAEPATVLAATQELPAAVELPTDFHFEAPKSLTIDKPESEEPKEMQASEFSSNLESNRSVQTAKEGDVKPKELEVLGASSNVASSNGTKSASETEITQNEAAATADDYFELLQKVAKGEITAQTLGQMFQSGEIGPSSPIREQVAGHDTSGSEEPNIERETSKPAATQPNILPYPTTPTDKKSNEDACKVENLPYPLTPVRDEAESAKTSAPI